MKLVPRFKPSYSIKEMLASISFSRGNIPKFEQSFAQKFNCDYGVMFSYGRTGLYGLFKSWELNDCEVICPAYTCIVVPHAIVLSGNKPVFIDCAPNSFNMDIKLIEEGINKETRAIVVTHLFGYPMNVKKIQDIVSKAEKKFNHKIYVIQDCAHSFGCKWDGDLVTSFGDAAIFGLNISKIINSIFGGMVITNSKETYNALKLFREKSIKPAKKIKFLKRFIYFWAIQFAFNEWIYGFVNWCERKGFLDRFVKYYDEEVIDFPKDWDEMPIELEARIGCIQLKKYDQIVKTKQDQSASWKKQLSGKNITFVKDDDGATYSHCVGLVDDREKWLEDYRLKNIQLGTIIEYTIPGLKQYLPFSKGDYPLSNRYKCDIVNFPNCKEP